MACVSDHHKKHLHRQTSPTTAPEAAMRHHEGCHDMMFYELIEFFLQKMTRHGRRHKSPRDASRRVWEARTTVFGGLTTGSRTHRFRFENGGERRCWFVRPSVVLMVFRIKTTVRMRTYRRNVIDNDIQFAMPHRFRIC